ncbi:MAG: DNA polymerase III subunit delta [Clostridia bacterium]|nr:DNA polymerase III subunit delta [Clostridia bacterium]MDD4798403.1 DNA polymerase III subunit delta [Clostridia bacterium]
MTKQLYPAYLFFGEETYLQKQALEELKVAVFGDNSLAASWNIEEYDGEDVSLEQVCSAAAGGGLFTCRRLVIVKNADYFKGKKKKNTDESEGDEKGKEQANRDTEALEEYFATAEENVLVFLHYGSVDKRSKLFKLLQKQGKIKEFAPLTLIEQEAYIERCLKTRGKTAERRAASMLAFLSGGSLEILSRELDKTCLFVGEEQEKITALDVEKIASGSSDLSVFALTDAVLARRGKQAVDAYLQLLRQGEAAQMILALLAKNLHNALLVSELAKDGLRANDIAAKLGLHFYVAEKHYKWRNAFGSRDYLRSMELLLAVDVAQKSGKGEIAELLETALLRICYNN